MSDQRREQSLLRVMRARVKADGIDIEQVKAHPKYRRRLDALGRLMAAALDKIRSELGHKDSSPS